MDEQKGHRLTATESKRQHIELQQWAVGVALADPEEQIPAFLAKVHPKAITEPTLTPVVKGIKAIMDDTNRPPTGKDVALWLQAHDTPGLITAGGEQGISNLVEAGEEAIFSINNVGTLYDALNAAAYHAELETLTSAFYNQVRQTPPSELDKFANKALNDLKSLKASFATDVSEYVHSASEIIDEIDQELEDARNGKGTVGIPLNNFPRLSDYIGGLRPGNLTIIAARPGKGKTTFCSNIVAPLSEAGLSTLFFSIEMKKTEIMKNIIACRYGLPSRDFNSEYGLPPEKQAAYDQFKESIRHWKLNVAEKGGIDIEEVRQLARRQAESEEGLDVIIVDYIQIVKTDDPKAHTGDQEKLAYVTYELKYLALELDVPIVATCQLNRANTNEKDLPPTPSSIRGSDAILQAASHVIALHRDDDEDPHVTQAIILKNRNGPSNITIHIDTALNICFFAEDMNETITQFKGGGASTQESPQSSYQLRPGSF